MAGFTIPNDPLAGVNPASFSAQAQPDKVDIDVLVAGYGGTGVVNGCAVTANGTGLTVDIAAGTVRVAGQTVTVAATSKTPGAASSSNPRFDLVVVSSAGVVSITAGTAAAAPCLPNVPASSVCLAALWVSTSLVTMTSTRITDKRVLLYPGDDRVFPVEIYGAKGDDSTDDTAAFQAAIDAAVAAKGGTILMQDRVYAINGGLSTANNCRSQLTFTAPAANNQDDVPIVLKFKGVRDQNNLNPMHPTGTVLRSNLTGSMTNDATYGIPSVLGGPTRKKWGSDPRPDLHVICEDFAILQQDNPTAAGINLETAARGEVCGVAVMTSVLQNAISFPTHVVSVGIIMPDLNNYNLNVLGKCLVQGFYCGYWFSEHTEGLWITAARCQLAFAPREAGHPSNIVIATSMQCSVVIGCYDPDVGNGSHVGPALDYALVDFQNLDIERAFSGPFVTTTEINDVSGRIWGRVRYSMTTVAGNHLGNIPVFSTQPAHLLFENWNEPTGIKTSPIVPASTTALLNPFDRDCAVTITGGTVTAIKVDGTAVGVTSGTVIVPTCKTVSITYSAAPSWVWVAL